MFFYDWEYFRNHPLEILLPFKFEPEFQFTGFAGLASHGAAIAIILVMYFYSKNIIKKTDALGVGQSCNATQLIGAIFVRIGSFFNSEIVGKITNNTTFGIKFIRDYYSPQDAINKTGIADSDKAYHAIATNPKFADLLSQVPLKHPAQLYESFCYIFVFFILLFLYWKTRTAEKHGLLFGVFLILLWSVRFAVEFVKEKQGGIEDLLGLFTTGQWLSIPFIMIGVYFLYGRKPLPEDIDF